MKSYTRDLYKHAQPIDINDGYYLKRAVEKRVAILLELFNACKTKCLNGLCSKNKNTCEQARRMANERPASEFIGFCRIVDEKECQQFRKVFNSLTKIVYDIDTKISGLEDGTTKNDYKTVKLYIEANIKKIEKPLLTTLNYPLSEDPTNVVPNSRRQSTTSDPDPDVVNNTNGNSLPGN